MNITRQRYSMFRKAANIDTKKSKKKQMEDEYLLPDTPEGNELYGWALIFLAIIVALIMSGCSSLEAKVVSKVTPLLYHEKEIVLLVQGKDIQPAKVVQVIKDSLIVDYIGTDNRAKDVKIHVGLVSPL